MRRLILLGIIVALLALPVATVHAAPPPDGPPGLERAITAQEAHNAHLLKIPGVVGTAVGLTADGKHAVKIFTERPGVAGLPESLDGVPVVVQVTGKFLALKPNKPPNGGGRKQAAPTITINTPPDGASYDEGALIAFYATVTDDKDVGLEGSITWESSYTGSIGQGNNLEKDLQAGVHIITASVTDSDGNTGSDSVMIAVSETGTEPTSTMVRWPRPVAIGISTGNANDVSAGTIACRVRDTQGNLYALSNTHVYAPYPNYLTNQNAIGHDVSQPGVYDILGQYDSSYYLGTVYAYAPINGSIFGSNTIDAAIAKTHLLGKATPSWGYGTPKKVTARARLGMPVKKFGRTTGLTEGTITGVNATIMINYDPYSPFGWYAWFVKQIIVESSSQFILPGDSGSLLVSNLNNPVGLLFAGDATGQMGLANEIGLVLGAFNVTIDGE